MSDASTGVWSHFFEELKKPDWVNAPNVDVVSIGRALAQVVDRSEDGRRTNRTSQEHGGDL
jgi:hypothetical protein